MKSIQWKIIVPFVIIISLTVLVNAFFTHAIVERTSKYSMELLDRQLNEKRNLVNKAVNMKIEFMMKQTVLLAKVIASESDIVQSVLPGYEFKVESLNKYISNSYTTVWLTRQEDFNRDGQTVIFASSGNNNMKGSAAWYYQYDYNIDKYGKYVSELGKNNNGRFVYYVKEPILYNRQVVGEVFAEVIVNQQFLLDITRSTNTENAVFLSAGKNDFVIWSDSKGDPLGEKLSADSYDMLKEETLPLSRLAQEQPTYEAIYRILNRVRETGMEESVYLNFDGVSYSLFFKPFFFLRGDPGAILVSRSPGYISSQQEIISQSQAMRDISMFVSAGLILLCFAISYLAGRKITTPIRKMYKAIRGMGDGDFSARIKYKGKDELAHLASAFNEMGHKIEGLIQEVYINKIEKKEAELQLLQTQMQPHFLSNTLSSISRLAKLGETDKLHRMVMLLAKFYRLVLGESCNMIHSIDKELQQAKAYIDIKKIVYGESITVSYDIDDDLLKFDTVKFILQPFIENVLMHAWYRNNPLHIRICIYEDAQRIVFKIIDNGVGMSKEIAEQIIHPGSQHTGHGIRNVEERIKLQYGESYGLTFGGRPGTGTGVKIVIPKYRNIL